MAHPLADSLCSSLTREVVETLQAKGYQVVVEDLYKEQFDPALNNTERMSYYSTHYEHNAVDTQVNRLLDAEALVLVFPTWWFGFPAILKGWFDRVWGPGVAYDHASDLGAITPRLHGLKRVLAITTLGSPWWVDWLILHRPVYRVLKTALLGTCTSRCKFKMHSLYKAEKLKSDQVDLFRQKVNDTLSGW